AKAPGKYAATSGTLTFAAGETSKTFTVALVNGGGVEDGQTVNLKLSNPTGGATLNPQLVDAVLTIQDDELLNQNEQVLAFKDKVFQAGGFFAESFEHYFDFVSKAYRRYLNREADDAGRLFWIGTLQSKRFSEQRVESFFVGSPEYISFRYGGSASNP